MTAGDDEGALFADLADRLRTAQQKLGQIPAAADRESLQQRLIAITNSAKHDLQTASGRLDRLLSELDEIA